MSKRTMLLVSLVILLLLVIGGVVLAVFLLQNGVGNGGGVVDYKVECDVKVTGTGFTKAKLGVINCDSVKKCGFLDRIKSSIGDLSIFRHEGFVKAYDTKGFLDSKEFRIDVLNNWQDAVSMDFCTRDSSVKFKLYDEDTDLIDEKIVQVS